LSREISVTSNIRTNAEVLLAYPFQSTQQLSRYGAASKQQCSDMPTSHPSTAPSYVAFYMNKSVLPVVFRPMGFCREDVSLVLLLSAYESSSIYLLADAIKTYGYLGASHESHSQLGMRKQAEGCTSAEANGSFPRCEVGKHVADCCGRALEGRSESFHIHVPI
jgi:hypothetical protein